MQRNTLTSLYTGSTASAPEVRSWARQPWHSPTQGNVASRGQAASWPFCFPLLQTQAKTSRTGSGRCLHRGGQHCVGMPQWSFFPGKSLLSFPFPILGELILTLVLWVLFCFTNPPAQGQLGSKRMKLRLCIVLQNKLEFLTSYQSCSNSSFADALPHNP